MSIPRRLFPVLVNLVVVINIMHAGKKKYYCCDTWLNALLIYYPIFDDNFGNSLRRINDSDNDNEMTLIVVTRLE